MVGLVGSFFGIDRFVAVLWVFWICVFGVIRYTDVVGIKEHPTEKGTA